MKKKIFLAVYLCCGMFAAMAQTAADSLAIVSANWQTEPLQKGMLYKKAVFSSLYGVPQEVSIFEISPKHYRFDVLVHNPKEETSIAARHAGAVAAINGSYFDMKAGNSVCYLRKDGVVIDTTSTGVLERVSRAPKHPRSAVALTREGKILLIVVDGRRKGKAEGINIPELAHMIRVLGGEDALNLDGGGSSTLWCGELPDKGIANTPSGSAERKVANSLCVYE